MAEMSSAVFTGFRIEFHSGTFHPDSILNISLPTFYKISFRNESFQNEFIPVVAPDRNFVPDRNLGERSTSIM